MCLSAAVRKEIADETDRETGRSKQISSVPIYLSIYSPNGMKNCLFSICAIQLSAMVYFQVHLRFLIFSGQRLLMMYLF